MVLAKEIKNRSRREAVMTWTDTYCLTIPAFLSPGNSGKILHVENHLFSRSITATEKEKPITVNIPASLPPCS